MSCIFQMLPIGLANIAMLGVTLGVAFSPEVTDAVNKNTHFVPRNVVDIIQKEYKTAFVDVDLLVKTLEEHGAEGIEQTDRRVVCKLSSMGLEFKRDDVSEPFIMQATLPNNKDCVQTYSELNEEYALNVQDDSYKRLKQKIENSNMEIENEEILEDNSIVITVNID